MTSSGEPSAADLPDPCSCATGACSAVAAMCTRLLVPSRTCHPEALATRPGHTRGPHATARTGTPASERGRCPGGRERRGGPPMGTPLWRRTYDAVERPIGSRLEVAVQTEQFAD